jgi:zinc protease
MTVHRLEGPAGSTILVEPARTIPLVQVVIASRTGAADDPRGTDGLSNLAGEVARRGAAGRPREDLDKAIDGLGATLNALIAPDSLSLTGHVLSARLEPYLAILADVVLRPDFAVAELARTRREVLAEIDESRNDDQTLAGRYWSRRLYGRHGYGRALVGTAKSVPALDRDRLVQHFRAQFSGKNLIFAASGDVEPQAFSDLIGKLFAPLAPGRNLVRAAPPPVAPEGWRVEIVDKPDRQQVQIMFGHLGIPAAHPDHLPLSVALTSFGGGAMTATMMHEVRTKRGLAYGAYMNLVRRRGPGPIRGFVFTGADTAVETLKLSLQLYGTLADKGLTEERVRFFQKYLAGAHATKVDDPARRLGARVEAELQGLPLDDVDTFPGRVLALSPDAVNAAIKVHVDPRNLAITTVATAAELEKRLVASGVAAGAIDIVAYDSY